MTALQGESIPEKQAIDIVSSCLMSYHNLASFSSSMFKAPVVLANDTLGGRFVPIYQQNGQVVKKIKPNYRELAKRIFTTVWEINPQKDDIDLISREIHDYFEELNNLSLEKQ